MIINNCLVPYHIGNNLPRLMWRCWLTWSICWSRPSRSCLPSWPPYRQSMTNLMKILVGYLAAFYMSLFLSLFLSISSSRPKSSAYRGQTGAPSACAEGKILVSYLTAYFISLYLSAYLLLSAPEWGSNTGNMVRVWSSNNKKVRDST